MKRSLKRGDIISITDEASINLGDNVQDLNRLFLIVSTNINNKNANIYNVISITSKVHKKKYPMHIFLDKNKYGLKYDSVALAEQVLTINQNYSRNRVSSLDAEDLEKLDLALFIQYISTDKRGSVIDFLNKGDFYNDKCKYNKSYKRDGENSSYGCKAVLQQV